MTALLAATAGRLAPLPLRAGRVVARVPLWLWLGLILLLAALGGGYLWLRDSSLVAVRQVQVIGAAGPQARQVRLALENAATNMTTLHLDRRALKTAVSPYPIVHDLRVEAHPPHKLTITVVAERPAARLVADGHTTSVSASGKVLRGSFDGMGLPEVSVAAVPTGGQATGRLTLAAIEAVSATPAALRPRLERAFWTGEHGLVIALRDGPRLYFGTAGRLSAKWAATARVLADPTSHGASYVDVRVPERPAAGGVGPEGQGQGVSQVAPSTATAPAATAPITPTTTVPSTTATTPSTTPTTPVTPATTSTTP